MAVGAYAWGVPLLHTLKQTVLDLGRGEAKAKAKPLTVGDETIDRSAAGLDNRVSERAVQFWLLSDRALFVVVGTDGDDHAYRIPFEAVASITLDYDEDAAFLPWDLSVALRPDGPGTITRLPSDTLLELPLGAVEPEEVGSVDRHRLAEGEVVPLSGFATVGKKFRGALTRRMELAGRPLTIAGAEAAERARFKRTDRKVS